MQPDGVEHGGAGGVEAVADRGDDAVAAPARRPGGSPVASTTVPPLITQLTRQASAPDPEEEEQDGHAHGDAVGDLLGDHGVGQVGHLGGDLDAPVHGAGVHDEGVVGQQARPARG